MPTSQVKAINIAGGRPLGSRHRPSREKHAKLKYIVRCALCEETKPQNNSYFCTNFLRGGVLPV